MPEIPLEEAPRKAREMFEKGFGSLERGNLDYAMDSLAAALELEPRLLRARRFLRAAAIKKVGKGNQFSHIMAQLKGLSLTMKARSSLGKRPEEAVKAAESLLRIDPLNPSFIRLFTEAAVAADMPEAAIMTIEVAKEHYPQDITMVQRLGELYRDTGQTLKAKDCFEVLVRMRPNDQKALKALKDASAIDTMKSGGWDAARDYRDVIKDSKEAALLEQQARAVKSGKGSDLLIADALDKVRRDPDNINYRRGLAELLAKAERYDEAIAALEEAFRLTGNADPEVDRAISTTRVRRYEHEVGKLREAGRAAEADALEQEKQQFIFDTAQERVRRYPNDLAFKYDLGVLLFDRGDLNEAIKQFQQSHRNPQRRTRSLYYMALCFKAKKQFDMAAEQLEKAASELTLMDDTKKDVIYELAQVAEATGDAPKALGHYKEIYAVDIGYRDVAAKIEKGYGG
jgi:tetratricopeptide (TPR) repeat protein